MQDALDSVPRELRESMSNVALVVEDEPPPGWPLLGLYQGIPLTRRGAATAASRPTRSRSTAAPSSGCTGPIRSSCAGRSGASSSTRWRITSGSATSTSWRSAATEERGGVDDVGRRSSLLDRDDALACAHTHEPEALVGVTDEETGSGLALRHPLVAPHARRFSSRSCFGPVVGMQDLTPLTQHDAEPAPCVASKRLDVKSSGVLPHELSSGRRCQPPLARVA